MSLREGQGVTDDGRRFRLGRGAGVARVINSLPADVERVYLLGPKPGRGKFDQWRAAVPDGWELASVFLENDVAPVLRYRRGDFTVEIHRAASWFGTDLDGYTVEDARRAMELVADQLRAVFGSDAMVLATPGTTGMELFVTAIPRGVEWDVLTDEHQHLIRSTSGQGRTELFPHPWTADPLRRIPALVELDGRFMYAALCRELGAGPAARDELPHFDPYARGRYRVSVVVPVGWRHVGVIGVHDGNKWRFPNQPGTVFETWCDGAELRLAAAYGWKFDVLERLLLHQQKADPLGGWARKLTQLRGLVDHTPLAAAAVRSILLHTIGRFTGKPRQVTHSCPVDEPGRVPADAVHPRVEGDELVWSVWTPPAQPELAHPEWAAAVWARARSRLLAGAGGSSGTGALSVPFDQVVAMRTDALYLTKDPGWADDGMPGRLRVKRVATGPFPWPRTERQLLEIREGK